MRFSHSIIRYVCVKLTEAGFEPTGPDVLCSALLSQYYQVYVCVKLTEAGFEPTEPDLMCSQVLSQCYQAGCT